MKNLKRSHLAGLRSVTVSAYVFLVLEQAELDECGNKTLSADDKICKGIAGCDPRSWKGIRDELIESDLIRIRNGKLYVAHSNRGFADANGSQKEQASTASSLDM